MEIFKLFGPLVLLAFFCYKLRNRPSLKLGVAMFFFASVAAFSQNFAFIYREIHQLVQLIIVLFSAFIIVKSRRVNAIVLPLFVFLIFIILSIMNGGFDLDARQQLINFIVVFFVTIFLFTAVTTDSDLKELLWFIGGLGVILSALTILEFLTIGVVRAEATFANPNYLALFLGISFVLVFYFHSNFKVVFLSLILLAIILTGSRSAIVIPLMAVLWSVYTEKFSYKKMLVILSSVLAGLALANSGSTRFHGDGLNASDAERILFTKVGYAMALDNPLTGVGWGRFITEFSNYSGDLKTIKLEDGEVDVSKHERRVSHNDLLRIAAELGLIAFFLVMLFLIRIVYILIYRKAFGFSYIVPIWFGLLLFSLTHNNLNTAFSWFFFLLPLFVCRSVRNN